MNHLGRQILLYMVTITKKFWFNFTNKFHYSEELIVPVFNNQYFLIQEDFAIIGIWFFSWN